jgi:hypothetical protein
MSAVGAGRPAPAARCRAMSRSAGASQPDASALRVDTAAAAPASMRRFVTMNPFHHDPGWRIPVPGLAGAVSSSMESVWQALKLVDGRTDPSLLDAPPVKRPPESQRGAGFDYRATTLAYRGRPIGLVAARYLIYLPAYLHVLDRLVPTEPVREIRQALGTGRDVVFYDWDDNFDIEYPGSSFSHSAVLAAWFAGRIEEEYVQRRQRWFARNAPELDEALRSDSGLALERYHRFHQH